MQVAKEGFGFGSNVRGGPIKGSRITKIFRKGRSETRFQALLFHHYAEHSLQRGIVYMVRSLAEVREEKFVEEQVKIFFIVHAAVDKTGSNRPIFHMNVGKR